MNPEDHDFHCESGCTTAHHRTRYPRAQKRIQILVNSGFIYIPTNAISHARRYLSTTYRYLSPSSSAESPTCDLQGSPCGEGMGGAK